MDDSRVPLRAELQTGATPEGGAPDRVWPGAPGGWPLALRVIQDWSPLIVVLAFVGLGIRYVQESPPFTKPDEIYHYSYVVYLHAHHALPTVELHLPRGASRPLVELEGHQPPLYYVVVAALTRGDPSMAEPLRRPNPHYLSTSVGNRNMLIVPISEETAGPAFRAFYVGRYVSLVFGVIAILSGFLALRTFLSTWLATTAMTVMAFDPQFVFISTSFSNDLAGAAFATLGICLLLESWKRGLDLKRGALVGIVIGLGTLAKLSALGLIAPFLVLAVWQLGRDRRARAPGGIAAGILAILTLDGWWFVRNERLYGDPFALSVLRVLMGQRTSPPTTKDVHDLLDFIWKSYWLDFSQGGLVFASATIYRLLGGAVVLACLGACWAFCRRPTLRVPMLILIGWFAIVVVSLLRLTAATTAPMGGGRLLFPAALPVAATLSIGWASIPRLRFGPWLPVPAAIALVVFSILAPGTYLGPSFPRPVLTDALSRQPEHVAQVRFGSSIELVGYDVQTSASDDVLHVTYDWLPRSAISTDYSVFLQEIVHQPDGHDSTLVQINTYPSYGMSPTSTWRPWTYVVDQLDLSLKEPRLPLAENQRIIVISGLYDFKTMQRLSASANPGVPSSIYEGAIVLSGIRFDTTGQPRLDFSR